MIGTPRTAKLALSMVFVSGLLLAGCQSNDPTLTAAPPPSPGAVAPPVRANKPMMTPPGMGGKPAMPGNAAPQTAPK
jgi:hypothetical protein